MNSTFDTAKYIKLLEDTVPTLIEDEDDYRRIGSEVSRIKAQGEDLTPEEVKLLKLLLSLMQQYENSRLQQISPEDATVPPHAVLRELMNIRGLKQKDLQQFFGGHKSNTSAVLNGNRPISKEQAKALGEFFHVSPALFI